MALFSFTKIFTILFSFFFISVDFFRMCIVFVLHGFYCTDVSTYLLACIFKSCFFFSIVLNFRPEDDLNRSKYIVKK